MQETCNLLLNEILPLGGTVCFKDKMICQQRSRTLQYFLMSHVVEWRFCTKNGAKTGYRSLFDLQVLTVD